MSGVRKFLSKNAVLMIMVPGLFGAHYGWYKLQYNNKLVSPEERDNLPIIKTLQGKSA